jgi:DNA repair photolyase
MLSRVKPRDVSNPPNRFHSQVVTYDDGEGPPPVPVTLIDDRSRSILSENNSPDLGFRWSVNPYRGCQHACAYCLDGETPILLADSRTRRLAELRVGDDILGTVFDGKYRRYARTRVLAHWATRKLAYRIVLADGTELVASGDHRFLTHRGWKYVVAAERPAQRPHLTTNNALLGTGQYSAAPGESDAYRRGYLCGMIRGDGTLRRYDDSGRRRGRDVLRQFRLALVDLEALTRARRYLDELAVETTSFKFAGARAGYAAMGAIRTSSQAALEQISSIIAVPDDRSLDWDKGFLAGIFDAEGSRSHHVLRISNTSPELVALIESALTRLGFDFVVEGIARERGPIYNVRLRGGLRDHLRFFHTTGPAISRKWDIEGTAVKNRERLSVRSIEPVGIRELFDITTGTGDFVANGVISHNCYARPTHEYLDLGAGTDFDTQIVVKREAPELLRAAFDRPSWKGELVMFSGVTDCYQPIERELELTRRCLEVCLAYRNPVSVISKSALVERDVDLFLALAREARCHMSVSLAFTDNDMARALEPWAPSPDRRFKVIETMAKAGVPVGVMCAPVIPGLNDSQMVRLLERAAAAGATTAGWSLLRLPGAVADVFQERIRGAMPLAADKILHRIRETRGGEKLYDSRFHVRGRGHGTYAALIASMFATTTARLGLNERRREKDRPMAIGTEAEPDGDGDDATTTFRRPARGNQLGLFDR